MLSIRVGATWTTSGPTGGTWLHGIRAFGDLSFSSSLRRCTGTDGGGGLLAASWSMASATGTTLPPMLDKGSLVEVKAGPHLIGMGTIAETPRGDSVVADGLFRMGERFLAVTSGGLPTTDVSVAVAQAIVNGLYWRDPGTLPTGAVAAASSTDVQYNTVSALLNQYCSLNNKIWWIDRFGYLRIGDYPTTPRWLLSPSLPSMESADDDFVSQQFVRYTNSATSLPAGTSATDATAPTVRQDVFDLEQLGPMTTAAAGVYASAILAANKNRTGFTEGLSVIRGQIMTLGGVGPEPWQIFAVEPTMVRSPNWVSASSRIQVGRRRDWILGGTSFKQGEPLVITPMGMAPRTVASIVQADGKRAELTFK